MQSHQSDTTVIERQQTWGKFPLFHWLWKWVGNSSDVGPPVSWGALDAHYSAHNTHSTVCVTHLQFSYTKPLWDRNICPWLSVTVTWPQPARDQENHHEHEPYDHSLTQVYRQKKCTMIHCYKNSSELDSISRHHRHASQLSSIGGSRNPNTQENPI